MDFEAFSDEVTSQCDLPASVRGRKAKKLLRLCVARYSDLDEQISQWGPEKARKTFTAQMMTQTRETYGVIFTITLGFILEAVLSALISHLISWLLAKYEERHQQLQAYSVQLAPEFNLPAKDS